MDFMAETTPAMRQAERDQIAADVEAFLKAGGKIQQVVNQPVQHAPSKNHYDLMRSMCVRWAQKFDAHGVAVAREQLKKDPEALVSSVEVAAMTGLARRTIEGWKHKPASNYLLTKPFQLKPLRFRLVDVVAWVDTVLEKAGSQ